MWTKLRLSLSEMLASGSSWMLASRQLSEGVLMGSVRDRYLSALRGSGTRALTAGVAKPPANLEDLGALALSSLAPIAVEAIEDGSKLLARGAKNAFVGYDHSLSVHALRRKLEGVRSRDDMLGILRLFRHNFDTSERFERAFASIEDEAKQVELAASLWDIVESRWLSEPAVSKVASSIVSRIAQPFKASGMIPMIASRMEREFRCANSGELVASLPLMEPFCYLEAVMNQGEGSSVVGVVPQAVSVRRV